MAKKALLVFLTLLVSLILKSQTIEFESGWGSYHMSELKDFQDYLKNEVAVSFPLNLTASKNFPPNIFYHGNILFAISKIITTGIGYGYYTTGSRLSYSDYSGYYYIDLITTGNAFRIPLQFKVSSQKNMTTYLYGNLELIGSKLTMNEKVSLYGNNQEDEETINLFSTSIYFEPGIKFSFLYKKCNFNINMGYTFGSNGKLHLKDEPDKPPQYSDDKYIRTNWGGFRLSVGIGYNLSLIK